MIWELITWVDVQADNREPNERKRATKCIRFRLPEPLWTRRCRLNVFSIRDSARVLKEEHGLLVSFNGEGFWR